MNITTGLATTYIHLSRPFKRRGLYRFMAAVNKRLPQQASRPHQVRLSSESSFSFPAGDPYWLSVFVTGKPYEPELLFLLDRLGAVPALFLDCGANFGYWSVVNSERMRTVAVEASSETYRWLNLNSKNNRSRYTALNAAITDGADEFVSFSTGGSHAGRSIVPPNAHTEKITARSVDSLVASYLDTDGLILIKLDVEGVEVPAFRGASETFKRNSVFLYEDHYKDADCTPTAFLLASGRRIFYLSEHNDLAEIKSVAEARSVKLNPAKGYNFIALGDQAALQT